jgi:hypothetical protein
MPGEKLQAIVGSAFEVSPAVAEKAAALSVPKK